MAIGPFTVGAQIRLEDVGPQLRRAQLLPVVVLVGCVMGSLITRAARWQIYFLPKRRVPFKPLLSTLAISYMASTFLPLRAGELVRAVFLGQRQGIPIPGIVGTILVEKLFDFLAIGVMLAVLLVLKASALPPAAQVAGVSITAVILVGFTFIVALAIWREPTLNVVGFFERRLPFASRLHLRDAAMHFAEGTDSLRDGRLWVLLLAWTAVTWLCAIGSTVAGMSALNLPFDLPATLFVVVLTSTGQAVPSSPGYVGVYHAAATLALTTFGVDTATALGVALITHAFSYGSLVVVGLIALWTGGYTFSDLLRGSRTRGAIAAPVSAEL